MADAKGSKVRCRVAANGFRTAIKHTLTLDLRSPLGRAAIALDDASHVHWVGSTDMFIAQFDVDSLGVAWLRDMAAAWDERSRALPRLAEAA